MSEKPCACKDCVAAAERKNKHQNHPFYKTARSKWLTVQNNQIDKGAEKYPNPFEPSDWTTEDLVNHALEENVDQLHYIVGLGEQLKAKEKIILELKKRVADLELENRTLKGEF